MKDELQDAMERTKRYDNIDGTGEMFMGWMLLGFALLSWLQAALPEHSVWVKGVGLLFMPVILIPVLGIGFGIQRLIKKHITWPRTGYVAYNPDKNTLRKNLFRIGSLGAAFGVVFGVGLACLMVFEKKHSGSMNVGRGFYLGLWVPIYAIWVFRMGRQHPWKWLLVLFMAIGLILIGYLIPGDFMSLARPVVLFVGFVWMISGAGTMVSYLRHTQPPVREAE